jgi:hypothetical protein
MSTIDQAFIRAYRDGDPELSLRPREILQDQRVRALPESDHDLIIVEDDGPATESAGAAGDGDCVAIIDVNPDVPRRRQANQSLPRCRRSRRRR